MNNILLTGIEKIPALDTRGNFMERQIWPGQYKKTENYVIQPDGTIHEYVVPNEVSFQIDMLCQWLNDESINIHPIIRAAIAHYNLVRIHPFDDGNGRGARLLMNVVLLKDHFQPTVIEVKHREDYLKALKIADKGDLAPFAQFVAESTISTQKIILDEIRHYIDDHADLEPKGPSI